MSYQNQATQNDPYKAQSRKSKIMMGVGGIVLALLAGFALGAGGVVGLGSNDPSGQVALQGGDGTGALTQSLNKGRAPSTLLGGGLGKPITQQLGQGTAPVAQNLDSGFLPPTLNQGYNPSPPVTSQYDKMPADVRAWLEHLAYTESERKRLASKQVAMFMSQMMSMSFGGGGAQDLLDEIFDEGTSGSSDPNQNYDPSKLTKLEVDAKTTRKSWRDINAYFNSKQPPAECVPIKISYEQCLGETSAMILEILDALDSSHGNPQGALQTLIGLSGTSQGKIDVHADQTDSQVAGICRKYETFKWFSVSGDIGGGLGALGGLGGGLGGMNLGDLDLSSLIGG